MGSEVLRIPPNEPKEHPERRLLAFQKGLQLRTLVHIEAEAKTLEETQGRVSKVREMISESPARRLRKAVKGGFKSTLFAGMEDRPRTEDILAEKATVAASDNR